MPKVSVVMASYNHERFVAETIQSVLDQSYQDFEFIITDDGSADRTVDVINRFDDPRIKLFCFPQNHGACRAINNCINEAKGEYIAVINSDDAWFPNKLEKQVNFLDSHPDIGAVFSYAQIIDEDSNDLAENNHAYQKIFIQQNKNRFEWLKHLFWGNCLCHPSILIRKVCYEITGLYDERYAQLPDWDFWIRLCMRYDIHIITELLTKFRVHQNEQNASGNRPDAMTRFHLETTQVMRNYLNPLVIENFLEIFSLSTNVPEAGVSVVIEKIESELIPFFIAKIALQIDRAAYKYFGLDLLYKMCSNPEIAQRLKNKYSFDFNSLTGLASQQDIFGTVHMGEMEARLQRKNSEIAQIKEDKQDSLDILRNQIRELEILLEGYQTQLHQTEDVSVEHQSNLSEIESFLDLYQSQLHQTEVVLEECHTKLKQEQTKVSQLEEAQQTRHHFIDDLRSQLHQVEDVLIEYKTELGEVEVIALSYYDKYLESQAESKKSEEQFKTQINAEEKVIYELHKAEALLSEYETRIAEVEATASNYQGKYLESQIQLQQAQTDAKEYQDRHHKSEDTLRKYQTEIEQLKEQFHTSISEAEKSIEDVQQQLNQTESIKIDYKGYYEETQLELQKVRSHLHQKQTELKRYQSEHHQLSEELSILHHETTENVETITKKQEIIIQLEVARNNFQQEAEQLELLLQESQSNINELQQDTEDLLSRKQDDVNTYKQELSKMHQNQVNELKQSIEDILSNKQNDANIYRQELNKMHQNLLESEIALANSQSQLEETKVEIKQLKSWQAFNDSQVSEGGVSKYKTLVWQAWQAYSTANYAQMANYLQQSLGHTSLSRAQAMIDWIENFGRFALVEATDLDTYFLTNLPEWQQLVRQVVRSPLKLSISNGMILK